MDQWKPERWREALEKAVKGEGRAVIFRIIIMLPATLQTAAGVRALKCSSGSKDPESSWSKTEIQGRQKTRSSYLVLNEGVGVFSNLKHKQ